MKIKFYNLGTIRETELDLRPLTIIIGPNNSNKTYIAYSVYGLLQQAAQKMEFFSDISFEKQGRQLTITYDMLLQSAVLSCHQACRVFKDEITTFYQDSSTNLFQDTHFDLQISPDEVDAILTRLVTQHFNTGHNRDYHVEYSNGKLTLSLDDSIKVEPQVINGNLFLLAFGFVKGIIPQLTLLPAERNAFIITYKVLLNKRYSLLRDKERRIFSKRDNQELQLRLLREQGDIRYPQPIEDFLEMLSDIELSHGRATVPKSVHSNGQNGTSAKDNFADVARQIERYIQGGNQTTFRPTTLGGSELMVHVSKALSIDLYNASSSIKQLAPLLLYLRYRAAENDLLIIDEPEMNLHPESQVKLLEILAILVNAGVRVMLTTHSPYFMSHLNNLVQSEQHSEAVKKRQAASLYLKDQRAFLNEDQVSAYEMRANEKGEHYLHSLKDAEFGIRYDTLSDVSVDVQQKYFEIAEKGRTTRRGKGQKAGTDVS